jgi:hypothetical protein
LNKHSLVLVASQTKHAATKVVEDGEIILIKLIHDAATQALLCTKLGDTVMG